MYKRLTNITDAEVSEARNTPINDAVITVSGIRSDISTGDTVLLTQHLGTDIREFPLLVADIEFKKGNTIITGGSLLQQVFDCIIPDMEEQSGNATDIIKVVLNKANTEGFIDIYVNDMNFDTTAKAYSKVNVKNRHIGEVLQDIAKDLGFVMWVGYDEINDKANAFFFRDSVNVEQNPRTLKEGANILAEDLHKTSLDEIINYIFMYYYPDKYPFDENWTEKCQDEKLYHALSTVHLGDIGTVGDVKIRNEKAFAYLTVDVLAADTDLTVNDTTGFDASGDIVVNGFPKAYSSKDATHFYLSAAIGIDILKDDSFIYPYSVATYPNVPDVEWIKISVYLKKDYPITHLKLASMGAGGSPEMVVRLQKEGNYNILQKTIFTPALLEKDVNWIVSEDGIYFLIISSDKVGADNFLPGMGECASKTGNTGDSEFQYWIHIGSPMKENFGLGDYVIRDTSVGIDHTDPTQQTAIEITMSDGSAPLWTGNAYSDNTYKQWTQSLVTINVEGYDSLRIESGTAILSGISINTALYIQFHLWYKGGLSQIVLKQDAANYWTFNFSLVGAFTEKTIKLSEGTKTGNPSSITSIEITVTSRAWINSLYFLPDQAGTLLVIKDDASIVTYHQHPKVMYAKGITESSLATSLGQAIIDDNKDPRWAGNIKIKDYPFWYTPMQKIKVIIGTKDISETMDILKVTHYHNGNAELEVGKYQDDFGRELAKLRSDIQNMQLTMGDTTVASETSEGYVNHGVKHQLGGSDQINVQGLLGELDGEQKSNWAKITDKPTSTVGNIDDAVTKRHTQGTDQHLDYGGANQVAVADVKDAVDKKHSHANKALLDSYDQTNADLADAVTKKHSDIRHIKWAITGGE